MIRTMQNTNSFIGLAITMTGWIVMKILLFLRIETLADLAAVATTTSAFVVVIANLPKFIKAIKIFLKIKS